MRFYFFAYVQFLKHDIKIHIEKHGSFAEKKKKKQTNKITKLLRKYHAFEHCNTDFLF